MTIWLIFLTCGCFVGFFAGLLGIGGGTIVVPIIIYTLKSQGVESDLIMKIAISTSFAVIISSTASAAWSHNKRGGVLWPLLPNLIFSAIIGVIIGAYIVTRLNNTLLQIFFCIFLTYTIIKMLYQKQNQQLNKPSIKPPHPALLSVSGLTIGFLASFIGIAGGAITVPLLSKLGYNMRKAIATSAVLGATLSLTGALSGIYHGWSMPNLPDYSLGYVYLPAFLGIGISSIFFAPLGAKVAYQLPIRKIQLIFALFLIIVLIDMLVNIL